MTTWMLNLLAPGDEVDAILGDLHEECAAVAERDGAAAAARWRRRQLWSTIWHLLADPIRSAPLRTLAIGIAGLIGSMPLTALTSTAAVALVTRQPVYYYVPAPTFWTLVYLPGWFVLGAVATLLSGPRPMRAPVSIFIVILLQFLVADPLAVVTFVGLPYHDGSTLVYLTVRAFHGIALFGLPMLAGAVATAHTRRVALIH